MKKCNCCGFSLSLKWLINPLLFFFLTAAKAAEDPLPPGFLSIYGVENGLSQSTVYDVVQDARGFIWVATGEGLNRFDGHRFVHFHKSITAPGQLSESIIRGLMPAKDSGLWIGTNKYIWHKPFYSDQFRKYPISNITKGNIHLPIWEEGSFLWGKTQDLGIFRLNRVNGKVSWYPFPEKIKIRSSVITASNKFYYVSDQGHILLFDAYTSKYRRVFPKISDAQLLTLDPKNRLILLTKKGLFQLNPETSSLLPFNLYIPNAEEVEQLEISGNYLWTFNRKKGLYCMNLRERKWHKIGYPDIPYNTEFDVFKIRCDHQGNIWVASDGPGLIKANGQRLKFRQLRTFQSETTPSRDFVRCIQEDEHGCILLGTFQEGVALFSPDLKTYTHLKIKGNRTYSVSQMTRDQKQRVCLATSEGLYYLNSRHELVPIQEGKAFHYFLQVNDDHYLQFGNDFLSLNTGTLIPGYSGATLRFSTQIGPDLWFLADRNSGAYLAKGRDLRNLSPIPAFSDLRIFQLLPLSDSLFVMSTDAGVIFLNQHLKILKTLGAKNGLPDQHIYGFLKDDQGVLWGSTNRGLFSIAPDGIIRNYSPEEGMSIYEFNSQSFHRSRNGNFFFGGTQGCLYFHPQQIAQNLNGHVPSVWVTNIQVDNRPIQLKKDFPRIELKPGRYDIGLYFAVTDYFIPEKNSVQIKISGLSSAWNTSRNKGFYKLDGLTSGNYVVWARAINSDGLYGKEVKIAEINIAIPLWRKLWFWIIISLFILMVSILITMRWVRKKSEQELNRLKKEEELEKVRKQIYRDLHDEIGSGLSKIQLLSDLAILDSEKGTGNTLTEVKATATDVTRKLREIVWAMKGGNENLPALFLRLQQIMEDLFHQSKIRHRVFLPDHIPPIKLDPVLIRNVLLTYRELLTNIIKHSAATEIIIQGVLKPDGFEIQIDDNGVGLNIDFERSGNGVEIVKQRMADIKGKIEWFSENNAGTRVTLFVPLESHDHVINEH